MAYTSTAGPPVKRAKYSVLSWIAVAVVPFLLVIGFVLGTMLVGDPNDPASPHGWDDAWRVILLWAVLEVIPAAGIWTGGKAVRAREPGARGALVANVLVFVFFVAVTLVGGLADTVG